MSDNIVTRIAPSPTGHLHIGTARTALFNYLFARHHAGAFIFRTEDTDRARSTPEYEAEIREGLEWLGLEWDASYRQSERADIYRNYLATLIENGTAYISKEPAKDDPSREVEVIRLKNPGTTIVFNDLIRGEISFDTAELGDFVIARSLDDALYHFTVVVDDMLSGVTHVIRGEDHISNTPRQILIQEALGAARPQYAHLPLILAPDRSKLSKRFGAVSLNAYREQGFLPQGVVNYLALLGWNPGTDEELFSLDDLVERFDLTKVQKGGAIFDTEKFRWFNREHIKRLSDEELLDAIDDWIPERYRSASIELKTRLLPLVRERVSVLSEITAEMDGGELSFVFETPAPDPALIAWKKDPSPQEATPRLARAAEIIASLSEWPTAEQAKSALWPYAEEAGKGEVLWPLRVALTGREKSPDPFSAIAVLGREEALRRLNTAIMALS